MTGLVRKVPEATSIGRTSETHNTTSSMWSLAICMIFLYSKHASPCHQLLLWCSALNVFIMSYYFKRSFVLQCPISYSSRILYVGIYMLISTRFIVWLSICHLLVGIFVSNNFDKWMNTRVVLTSVFSIFTEPISNAKVFRMHLLFDFVSFLVVYWFSLYVGYDI